MKSNLKAANVATMQRPETETVSLMITSTYFHVQAGRMTSGFDNNPALVLNCKLDEDKTALFPWMRKGLEVTLEVHVETDLNDHGPWKRGMGSVGYIDAPEDGPYVGERGQFQNIGENGEAGISLAYVFMPEKLQALACMTRKSLTSVLMDVGTKARKGEVWQIIGLQLLDSETDRGE